MYKELKAFKGVVELKLATPTLVKEVQTILKALKLYDGAVDGIVGKQTLSAFADFKEKEYLGEPTKLGESTAKALVESVDEDGSASNDSGNFRVVNGYGVVIPGLKERVEATQPIYPGSHFTWGEATKGLTRIPPIPEHTKNIIRTAQVMDEVREYLGDKPITVTSWLRPVAVNRAVGGASNSQHIYGRAVDFVVQSMTTKQVLAKLDAWYGKRGGLAASASFVHIDTRQYYARWKYGAGV